MEAIAKMYSNPGSPAKDQPTPKTFLEWRKKQDQTMGIWELDQQHKALQAELWVAQDCIIEGGSSVKLPTWWKYQ
jgi:hypothetical protein